MFLSRCIVLFALICASLLHRAEAGSIAEGTLDSSFGLAGNVRTAFDLGGGNRDTAPTVVIDSVGRIFTFAEVSLQAGTGIGMSRHLANGSPDTTLGPGGKELLALPLSSELKAPKALLAPDGKLYLLVRNETSDNLYFWALCRLFVLGTPDPTFAEDGCRDVIFNLIGGGRDYPTAMAFDNSERMVLGGYVQATGGFRAALARINLSNSTVDGSFGIGGKTTFAFSGTVSSQAHDLAVLDDNRIAFVGSTRPLNSLHLDVLVARVTSTGELDATYADGSGFRSIAFDRAGSNSPFSNDTALALALEPRTGGITLVGRAQLSATSSNPFVARLIANGAFDLSFSGDGTVVFGSFGSGGGWFTDIKIDGRKRIYAYGNAEQNDGDSDLLLMRIGRSGGSDLTFGNGRIYHNIGPAGRPNLATELHFMAGKPLMVGSSLLANQDYDLNLTRVWSDLIFADGLQ